MSKNIIKKKYKNTKKQNKNNKFNKTKNNRKNNINNNNRKNNRNNIDNKFNYSKGGNNTTYTYKTSWDPNIISPAFFGYPLEKYDL